MARLNTSPPRLTPARRAGLLAGAALFAAIPLTGCALGAQAALTAVQALPALAGVMGDTYERTGSHTVPAQYEGLRSKDFAVIVSADAVLQANHPRAVTVLTNAMTNRLTIPEVGATGVVPGPRVLEFQYTNPSWQAWSWSEIADEFTVDRLIVVELEEYRLHEAGNMHVWDGRIAVRVGVVEVDSFAPEEFSFVRELRVSYPDGATTTTGELSEQHIEAVLQQRITDRVTWLFYEHEEMNMMRY